MHSPHDTQPRRIAVMAAAALLLAIMSGGAMAQSQSPAAQTALAIAGPASMTAAPPDAAPTSAPLAAQTASSKASGREMLPEDRRQLMMLLILRQTSRNPIGSLR
jgi:uncharacterized protein YggE